MALGETMQERAGFGDRTADEERAGFSHAGFVEHFERAAVAAQRADAGFLQATYQDDVAVDDRERDALEAQVFADAAAHVAVADDDGMAGDDRLTHRGTAGGPTDPLAESSI